jgi:hypothetical protein
MSDTYFAEKHLCIQRNQLKKLVSEPVAWERCSDEEKSLYRCCSKWVNGGEEAVAKLKAEFRTSSKLKLLAKQNNEHKACSNFETVTKQNDDSRANLKFWRL